MRCVVYSLLIGCMACGSAAPQRPTEARSPMGEGRPAEVARLLADPGTRYAALDELEGIRSSFSSATVRTQWADGVTSALSEQYVALPGDERAGQMLELLGELADSRALPALRAAFTRESMPEEVGLAAEALSRIDVPDAAQTEFADLLVGGLMVVHGVHEYGDPRNQPRMSVIRALGTLRVPSSERALLSLVESDAEFFPLRRLAAQELSNVASSASVPVLLKALFTFATERDPDERMSLAASEALVAIGQPAVEPLLALLRGENAPCRAIAEAYAEAQRGLTGEGWVVMLPEEPVLVSLVGEELMALRASYLLGFLGDERATEELRSELGESPPRAATAAVALMRIAANGHPQPDLAAMIGRLHAQDSMVRYRSNAGDEWRQHNGFDHSLSFSMSVHLGRQALPVHTDLLAISQTYTAGHDESLLASMCLLAAADDVGPLRQALATIRANPDRDPDSLGEIERARCEPRLMVANECDMDASCYTRMLAATDPEVVQKATIMLAELGGRRQLPALLEPLGHPDSNVRRLVFYAVDRLTPDGDARAVAGIDELEAQEAGEPIWDDTGFVARLMRTRWRHRLSTGR